jgi:hypothetical protein
MNPASLERGKGKSDAGAESFASAVEHFDHPNHPQT